MSKHHIILKFSSDLWQKRKNASDLEEEQPRRVSQADRARAGDDDEDVADAVAAVVEELTHRTGGTRATRLIKQSINRFNSELYFNLFSFKLSENLNLSWTSDLSSHLLSIDGVQRLVEEETQSAQEGRPPGSL